MLAKLQSALKERGLNHNHAAALEILAAEPLGPSAVAEKLSLSKPAGTQLLDKLERQSLIERIDYADRRSRKMRLTTLGEKTLGDFLVG